MKGTTPLFDGVVDGKKGSAFAGSMGGHPGYQAIGIPGSDVHTVDKLDWYANQSHQ
jgi:hypothetical protein